MFDIVAAAVLALAALLIATLAISQLATTIRIADARQSARLAAEAEIARWQAGMATMPGGATATSRESGSTIVETTLRPGEGVWRGLTLVRVIASRQAEGARARVELSAYVVQSEGAP